MKRYFTLLLSDKESSDKGELEFYQQQMEHQYLRRLGFK
jgi:hypothetical protein